MIDPKTLRAWWWKRQRLDGSLKEKTPEGVLEATGWARSVGGAGPYLTFFSRARLSRETVDRALAAADIHELPSARGCTYVVPQRDYALALTVAAGYSDAPLKQAMKFGVTTKEIDKLQAAVVKALKGGELDPEGIREAVGGAARSLGPEAQKKGITTTLPIALGLLQTAGEIRRIPVNGRLDQQRYRYARWADNPLAKSKLSREEAFVELARRYFTWVAPATLQQFAWFAGLGVKAAKEAIAPLKLAADGDRLMFEADLDALKSLKVPREPQYALVSTLDSITAHRRSVTELVDDQDLKRKVLEDTSLITLGALSDLPSHGILDRGRLIGLWEYDLDANGIAWAAWTKADAALESTVAETERWVRTDLGDARSFSLDSPKSRAPRIASLRKLAA
jgi:hypothetical protein